MFGITASLPVLWFTVAHCESGRLIRDTKCSLLQYCFNNISQFLFDRKIKSQISSKNGIWTEEEVRTLL